jgi:hypothetical protein
LEITFCGKGFPFLPLASRDFLLTYFPLGFGAAAAARGIAAAQRTLLRYFAMAATRKNDIYF